MRSTRTRFQVLASLLSLVGVLVARASRAEERGAPSRAPAVDAAAERAALIREIRSFGMIALVAASEPRKGGDHTFAPPDPKPSAMWRSTITDAFAYGLSGTGDEDGGRALGVALDRVVTVGGGDGLADVGAFDGHQRIPGAYVPHGPRMEPVPDRVEPDVIQRVVRASFGRFRLCYEDRLRRRPALRGRVAVRFTIDPAGRVAVVSDDGSSLPDQGVVACVVRGFAGLTFPESRTGKVTVVYPLDFRPADGAP